MAILKKFKKLFRRKRRKSRRKYPTYHKRQPVLESRQKTSHEQAHPRPSRYRRKKSAFKRWFWRMFRKMAVYGGALALVGYVWFSIGLPNIDDLNKFRKTPSIVIKAQDGQIIGSFGDVYGDYLSFSELPTSLVDAVMATEDRNFNHHFGIDPIGLARATLANLRAGKVVQGGSTITQQVAKNVFLTPERSFGRKIREMLLAFKLERRFPKQEIMSIYLNRVYLGAGSYGVDAAAKRYFGKSARELTLSESAIMAGLLKAPSRFAPTSNPTLSRKRAEQVLRNMEDAEYLTKQQTERAIADLNRAMGGKQRGSQSSMYFADWLMEQIPEYIGNTQEDLVVISTLDPAFQLMADKAINDALGKEGEKLAISQGALVAMQPDGAVRAMVGGKSYGESQYNRATQAQRQPGSSFKMFVYLAGLENGLTPDSRVIDQPITIGKWSPKNYTGRYEGEMTLKEALTQSINTVAVQVGEFAGFDKVVDVAHRLGINSEIDPLPSIALGSTEVNLLELTTAYAHLASEGHIVYPYGILQIETVGGEIVYQRRASGSGMAISPDIVGMMNDMLMSVVNNGTGRAALIGRPVAGKTGTTSDYKDALFVGYTPDLVAGVWVGNDDNTPMKKVTGGQIPARIWHDFMMPALADTPARSLPVSSGGIFNSLPWQGSSLPTNDSSPVLEAEPAPVETQEPATEEPKPRDVKLGRSFWDKLLGGNQPPVERKYPSR